MLSFFVSFRYKNIMKVYLAGPEVFLPHAHTVFAEKINICKKYGLTAVTPFDNAPALENFHAQDAAQMIFTQNIAIIDGCDALIANITPFRGVHMDPGTALEMGYAFAKNIQVAAYTQDNRELIMRLSPNATAFMASDVQPHLHHPEKFQNQEDNPLKPSLRHVDNAGYLIENFGLSENLMVHGCLSAQGRKTEGVSLPFAERFTSCLGFEDAVLSLL